jgi:hypothetical protein
LRHHYLIQQYFLVNRSGPRNARRRRGRLARTQALVGRQGKRLGVVLPEGLGTWDELWEMACARKLGLGHSLPICCINVNHFYQPFMDILQRAYEDRLLEQKPHDIVHFVNTAEEAVLWAEAIQDSDDLEVLELQKRSAVLRKSSFLGGTPTGETGVLGTIRQSFHYVSESLRNSFTFGESDEEGLGNDGDYASGQPIPPRTADQPPSTLMVMAVGVALGVVLSHQLSGRQR